MGESSDRVFNVGDLAISKIRKIKKLTLPEIQNKLNIKLKNKKIILITYHPVTTEKSFNSKYFKDLLKVLSEFNEFQLIFTNPNCDGQNFEIRRLIRKFVSENINSYVFDSLGSEIYLSLLNYCVLVMGNSSSGIIEVPEYRIPTLNIGNRQKGRLHGNTVINCSAKYIDIKKGLHKALSKEFQDFVSEKAENPYASSKDSVFLITEKLYYLLNNKEFYQTKKFQDLNY